MEALDYLTGRRPEEYQSAFCHDVTFLERIWIFFIYVSLHHLYHPPMMRDILISTVNIKCPLFCPFSYNTTYVVKLDTSILFVL